MTLRTASAADLYLLWTLIFMLALSPVALHVAENNLRSVAENLALFGGAAVVLAAWFAVPMWAVVKLAS